MSSRVAVTPFSFDDIAIRYVLPVLWMSCSHTMDKRARIKDDAYASSSSPDSGTGGEVCYIYDCRLVTNTRNGRAYVDSTDGDCAVQAYSTLSFS